MGLYRDLTVSQWSMGQIYFPLVNFHPDHRGEQDKAIGVVCVLVSAECLC